MRSGPAVGSGSIQACSSDKATMPRWRGYDVSLRIWSGPGRSLRYLIGRRHGCGCWMGFESAPFEEGSSVHRTRRDLSDTSVRHGLRVTDIGRPIADLAASVGPISKALESALRGDPRRLRDWKPDMLEAVRQYADGSRRGHWDHESAAGVGPPRVRSADEKWGRDNRLASTSCHWPHRGCLLDSPKSKSSMPAAGWWPRSIRTLKRLILESSSRSMDADGHTSDDQLHRDSERQNLLSNAFCVVRFRASAVSPANARRDFCLAGSRSDRGCFARAAPEYS